MVFSSHFLMQDISQEQWEQMMHCFSAVHRRFLRGQSICDYGEGNNVVGIIESGSAVLVRTDALGNRSILEILKAGAVFGDAFAFSSISTASISVVCDAPAEVLFIEYQHILKRCEKACEHHSLLVQNMLRLIADKVVTLNERLEVLSNRTIRQKLISYFLLLSAQQNSFQIELPFSMVALAEYIASDRSAMMRELRKMRDEGWILVEKRQITLLAPLLQSQ